MNKKLKKFRKNENPKSTQFTNKLNALTTAVEVANNLKLSIHGAKGFIDKKPHGTSIDITIPKGKGRSFGASLINVIVTEVPSYPSNDDISFYTVNTDPDNPSGGEEIEIDSVLGYKIGRDTLGAGEGLDMRDFTPWIQLGEIVPIIKITIDELTYVYFLQTFTYVGDSDARSIAWLEDEDEDENTPRAAAVFR